MEDNQVRTFSFEFYLKAYPIMFLGRSDLEKGDKILLPSNILQKLSESEINSPMVFEVKNTNSQKKSHCGIMDFTADEGCAYLPRWMMQNLNTTDGEKIQFKCVFLEKGNYVKLQPQTNDFLEISNPKAVLEAKLRYFTCLTKSDVIAIEYNNKIYWINVLEVKPGSAISIIDTDIDVDFAPPVIRKNPGYEGDKSSYDTENISGIEKKNITSLESLEESSTDMNAC